jgi:hypothetical protein
MTPAKKPNQGKPTVEEKLDELTLLVKTILIKLFGDVDTENDKGRIPMLEATVVEHEKRLRFLEGVIFKALGGVAVLWACVEVVIRVLSLFKK